jgi:nitroreductase
MRTLKTDPSRADAAPFASIVMKRRATQSFKPDPVPEDVLREILELATLAPSGYNLQPWRFLVLRGLESRRKLRAAAYNQPKIEEAPVVIIACGDTLAWRDGDLARMLRDARETGWIKDEGAAAGIRRNVEGFLGSADLGVWVTRQTMIAFTHLMLAAEERGLDTAPMEGFDEDKVRAAFEIPPHARVVALLALGYAKGPDKPFGGRFDLDTVVFGERYGSPWRVKAEA